MQEAAKKTVAQAGTGWFRESMKKCVARAVYAEIAMAADNWSYVALANRLSAHASYDIDTLEEKLRKLRDGTRAPTLGSWTFVADALPQANLRKWIEHPLFLLLNPPKQNAQVGDRGADMGDYPNVRRALDMVEGEIRDYLWLPPVELEPGTGTDFLQFTTEECAQIMASSPFDDLDWALKLTVMTALAKLGQWRGNTELWRISCRWTRNNFARAMAVTPQLLAGWIWLSDLFESQVWAAYRPHAHPLDLFGGAVGKDEIEAMVRTAQWHRERFGKFDALPSDEKRAQPLPYVPQDFLKKYCGLKLSKALSNC
jgi:hypothetical protein